MSDQNYLLAPPRNETASYTPNTVNQYTSVASAVYSYDANGNLIGDGTNSYSYDTENHMLTANAVALGNTVSFGYDPLGRRVSKVSTGALITSTSYLLDGDRELAEYDGTGATLLRRYVYGPGIDEPVVRIDVSGSSSTPYYTHQDGLGSVVAMTDATGAVVDKYSYGIYGESNSLSGNPYRFTGRRLDPETGLYYNRARYYSASLGRFMQNDPIGYAGGDNLYAYVLNDPVDLTDPSGLDTQISIGYKPIGLAPGEYHEVVILTHTATGQQFATRGGPSVQTGLGSASASAESASGGDLLASSGNAGSGGFGFGQIVGQGHPFNSEFRDPPSSIVAMQQVGTISRDFSESVKDAEDFAKVTNDNAIPYWALGPNSNSYASTFVESLTGTRPSPTLSAPGWDIGTPSPDLSYKPSQLESTGGYYSADGGRS